MKKLSEYTTITQFCRLGKVKAKNVKLIYESVFPAILVFTCENLKCSEEDFYLGGRAFWNSLTIEDKYYEIRGIFLDIQRPKAEILDSFFHEMIHVVCFLFKHNYPFGKNKDIEEMFAGIFGLETAKIFSKIEKRI